MEDNQKNQLKIIRRLWDLKCDIIKILWDKPCSKAEQKISEGYFEDLEEYIKDKYSIVFEQLKQLNNQGNLDLFSENVEKFTDLNPKYKKNLLNCMLFDLIKFKSIFNNPDELKESQKYALKFFEFWMGATIDLNPSTSIGLRNVFNLSFKNKSNSEKPINQKINLNIPACLFSVLSNKLENIKEKDFSILSKFLTPELKSSSRKKLLEQLNDNFDKLKLLNSEIDILNNNTSTSREIDILLEKYFSESFSESCKTPASSIFPNLEVNWLREKLYEINHLIEHPDIEVKNVDNIIQDEDIDKTKNKNVEIH